MTTSTSDPSSTACFYVEAAPHPGVMPRVLELFAKRGLVPDAWHSTHDGRALHIDIQMAGMDRPLADYVAACLRQLVSVQTVLVSEKRYERSA